MARNYRRVRPKRDVVYDAEAVRQLYGICENTLTNWRRAGLRATDDRLPTLFTGAELGRFHKARARARRRSLRPSEFLCLGCKAVVIPDPAAVVLRTLARGGARAEGPCPACGAGLSKLLNETDRHALERGLDLNASLGIPDEDDSASQAGVVTGAGSAQVSWVPTNERVLYDYLAFCGRYNPRTVEAIMASIRDFERSLGPKPFDRLTHRDVDAWRAALLKRGAADAPDAKSRSTIRHRASHVKTFLKWLVQQEGYRRLKAGLAEYAVLPKAASAQLLQPPPRPYPSIEEALALIDAMPAGTPRERRDRAIVAFVFLTGLRADTAASIRFGDVHPAARTVRVDARSVRAKNGKSLEIFWFPVGEAFEAVVRGWIDELASRGARAEDAFFPKDEALAGDGPLVRADDAPLERWASSDAIRRAFAIACRAAGGSAYTPHAARHSLKALGDRICRTEADRDGWSRNLGHESRQITVSHYAKLTDGQRKAVYDRLRSGETETDEEKDLLLAYFEHRLIPERRSSNRAESLADERRRRRRPSRLRTTVEIGPAGASEARPRLRSAGGRPREAFPLADASLVILTPLVQNDRRRIDDRVEPRSPGNRASLRIPGAAPCRWRSPNHAPRSRSRARDLRPRPSRADRQGRATLRPASAARHGAAVDRRGARRGLCSDEAAAVKPRMDPHPEARRAMARLTLQ